MSNHPLKEEYATLTTTILLYPHTPEPLDPLQEVLNREEQALLNQAVESELESRLAEHSALKT